MKVIFLDIDGVLNVTMQKRDEFGSLFHPQFEDNLKRIVTNTDAKIVITSTWRYSGLSEMQRMWKHRDLAGEVIDITPDLDRIEGYSIPRGVEIKYWLDNTKELESYVIIDDDNDMLLCQKDNFVHTFGNITHRDCVDIGYGLTYECSLQAIKILNSYPFEITT
jgi:hypothetical protein